MGIKTILGSTVSATVLLATGAVAESLDPIEPITQSQYQETKSSACAKPGNPYKGVFYANDFRYLEQECYTGEGDDALTKFGNSLKNIKLRDDITLDIGGQYRLRWHTENNHAGTRLNGEDNDFLLSRLRVYGSLRFGDHVQVYGEIIDAASIGEDRPPRGIEVDRWDLLNGFVDVNFDVADTKINVRAGRQELQFGQQRLISPLDWGNTRRAFDGVRVTAKRGDFTFNAFTVSPRTVLPNDSNPTDRSQDFDGLSLQYNIPGHEFELYSLRYDEDDPERTRFDYYTTGLRWKGREGNVLFEAEGGIQRGTFGPQALSAEYLTLGLGYDFKDVAWKPTVWAYYDYASGDDDPNDGVDGRFRQLFPLAHAWLGLIDLVARENIEAFRISAVTRPAKGVTWVNQFHKFNLASAQEGLFNAGGGRIRFDPTGQANSDVGFEYDTFVNFKLLQRMSLIVGYSHFAGGDFIDATNPQGVSGNADFFYVQWTTNF
ncbi:alginate export family protein [Kordiimonas sp. SCSIO 12610]|uniref:alginate export family protein n=1 Tax=Kordiimonas sp. SCSIO 12610 TaxID=2829597 RepID=UPI00210F0BCE|nr:alginate export family protein [Kordiimonas sp. SCSIO 12610]UTW56751.1 alginate export family protein [Kordiimonas sp. SCSIO 12610]